METAQHSSAIAVLFRRGAPVEIAAEYSGGVHSFAAENSDDGLRVFERELVTLQLREPPFICMCMTPGSHFEGAFFAELHGAPFPKLLLAQGLFLAYAQEHGLSPQSAETLLCAFRNHFPKEQRAA